MITTQGVTGHAIVQPPEAFETTNSRRPDGRVHGIDESRPQPAQADPAPPARGRTDPAPHPPELAENGHGMTTHSSRADVATDRPARYAKQLVSHLGRKLEFTQDRDTATAVMAGTAASITAGEGVLVLQVSGTDPDGVARAEGALASHLLRFGEKDELTVTWQRTTA